MSHQVNENQVVYGKGKWEDMEERMGRLEELIKLLVKDPEK
jgi:hypothetical protein